MKNLHEDAIANFELFASPWKNRLLLLALRNFIEFIDLIHSSGCVCNDSQFMSYAISYDTLIKDLLSVEILQLKEIQEEYLDLDLITLIKESDSDFIDMWNLSDDLYFGEEKNGYKFGLSQLIKRLEIKLAEEDELKAQILRTDLSASFKKVSESDEKFNAPVLRYSVNFFEESLTFAKFFKKEGEKYIDRIIEINNSTNEDPNTSKKTGVFDGIVFVKGISFGAVKSTEHHIRLDKLLALEENKPISYLEIWDNDQIKDNSVLQWKNRINKGLFKGKEIIHKDGSRVFWQLDN